MASINRILAASEDQELDPRHFLGRLATWTLPDEPVNGSKLVRAWGNAGLDPAMLPDVARAPVDVFRRACSNTNRRRGTNGGERTEIRADEVDNNGSCVYQITVKMWDRANLAIEHEKALRATFDKDTAHVEFDDLGYTDKQLDRVKADIQAYIDTHSKSVPGQKVRKSVQRTIVSVGGTNLRRKAGGLYFVPATWVTTGHTAMMGNGAQPTLPVLEGLRQVLEAVYGIDADFYTIPLINDEGAQEMVAKHFTLNVREEAQQVMLEAVERARQMKSGKGRKIREDALANFYNKQRKLTHALTQFEHLVELERGDIEADLEDLSKALAELTELRDADD